jgi:hypothetical protein
MAENANGNALECSQTPSSFFLLHAVRHVRRSEHRL